MWLGRLVVVVGVLAFAGSACGARPSTHRVPSQEEALSEVIDFTVAVFGGGVVDVYRGDKVSRCRSRCQFRLASDQPVTIRPVPPSCPVRWFGPCGNAGNTCRIELEESAVVKVEFAEGESHVPWLTTFPGDVISANRFTVVSDDGAVFVVGVFTTTISIGGALLSSVGGRDVYVAKLSSDDGTVEWASTIGGGGADYPVDLRLDGSGNPIVAVRNGGTIEVGGTTYDTSKDEHTILVAIDGASGDLGWVQPTPLDDVRFAAGPEGRIVVLGRVASAVPDVVVQYLSATRSVIWETSLASIIPRPLVSDVVVTSDGSIVVSGAERSMDHAAPSVAFIARLDETDGSQRWQTTVASTEYVGAKRLTASNDETLAVVGNFTGTVSVGGERLHSEGDSDVFLLSLSTSDGRVLLASSSGAKGREAVESLGGRSTLALAGTMSGDISLSGQRITPTSTGEFHFIAALNPVSLELLWSRTFDWALFDRTMSVSSDTNGNVFVAGNVTGETILDSHRIRSNGSTPFAMRISPCVNE